MKKQNYVEIMPNVFRIQGGGSNIYVIKGMTQALVYDTGSGFVNPIPIIKEITELPLIIVNSHGHVDHAGGNRYFNQPIYLHEKDREVYIWHQSKNIRKKWYSSVKTMATLIFWAGFMPKGAAANKRDYLEGPLFDNYISIKEGDCFDLGGLVLEAYEFPGHTAGCVGLLCREQAFLLVGDSMNASTWVFLKESTNLKTYLESLKKAYALPFELMLAGHSTVPVPKSELKEYIIAAENPDFDNAKISHNKVFAEGIEIRTCFPKGEQKSKYSVRIGKNQLLN